MQHKFINTLKPGEPINNVYLMTDKKLRTAKNGSSFLAVELMDKTGKIKGVIWDKADEFNRICKIGELTLCRGAAELYKDALQFKINNLNPDIPKDTDTANYIAQSKKDIELLFEELKDILAAVKSPDLAGLIKSFLADAGFVELLKRTPAAIELHHAYVGGLLEHTVNILNLARQITSYYHAAIDSDLLLTGIFLHDLGKTREYEVQITPRMTDQGMLLGHTIIGIQLLEEKARAVEDLTPERLTLLKHLIASHHGQHDFGAPVLPMTPEAMILHYLDNLDARIGEYQALLEKSDPDSNWTERSRSQERKFYKPK